MKTSLNLRFDKNTIEAAKKYALKRQTSVSEIVDTYLRKLMARDQEKKFISDDFIGILKHYKNHSDEELKELHLKGKHHA